MSLERKLRKIGVGLALVGGVVGGVDKAKGDWFMNRYEGTISFYGEPAYEDDVLEVFWESQYGEEPLLTNLLVIGELGYRIDVWADLEGGDYSIPIDFGFVRDGIPYGPMDELGPHEALFFPRNDEPKKTVNLSYTDPKENGITGNVYQMLQPTNIFAINPPGPYPPEPNTFLLFVSGLVAFSLRRRSGE